MKVTELTHSLYPKGLKSLEFNILKQKNPSMENNQNIINNIFIEGWMGSRGDGGHGYEVLTFLL